MAAQYLHVDTTATTTAQIKDFDARFIAYIKNDDTTNKLYISFEGDVAENYITVLPNEALENLSDFINPNKIYYKSSASTVAFRILGIK